MKRSRQHCIYCKPADWKTIRGRARKARISISRYGYLCARAAESGPEPAPPAGHPLVLTEKEQDRLRADAEALLESGRIAVRAPGGREAVVLLREAVRFRLLFDREGGA